MHGGGSNPPRLGGPRAGRARTWAGCPAVPAGRPWCWLARGAPGVRATAAGTASGGRRRALRSRRRRREGERRRCAAQRVCACAVAARMCVVRARAGGAARCVGGARRSRIGLRLAASLSRAQPRGQQAHKRRALDRRPERDRWTPPRASRARGKEGKKGKRAGQGGRLHSSSHAAQRRRLHLQHREGLHRAGAPPLLAARSHSRARARLPVRGARRRLCRPAAAAALPPPIADRAAAQPLCRPSRRSTASTAAGPTTSGR